MADDYQELDVFGRPVSKNPGVPYLSNAGDEDAALQDYAAGLNSSTALPGYVHDYRPGWAAQDEEARNPLVWFPSVRQGNENVRAVMEQGPETLQNIWTKMAGPKSPRYQNALGKVIRVEQPTTFDERWGLGRTELWPEKVFKSARDLPTDIMRDPTMLMPATEFSDVPGAADPYKQTIGRVQDLSGLAFGGSIPAAVARGAARNTLGTGFGRMESMPEILARQRASEGYEAAIRDPETKKLYTGMWHEEVLDKIAKDKGVPKDQLPENLVKGYIDDRGHFLTEAQVEKRVQNRTSKTAMFKADDEVGAAVAALHASEGKAPEMKVAPVNLPAIVPKDKLPAVNKLLETATDRRSFLRGARDLGLSMTQANRIVGAAEKLGAGPMAVPKMPKVPLKEIWKTAEEDYPHWVYDTTENPAWEYFDENFVEDHPQYKNFDKSKATPKELKAYETARDKFQANLENDIVDENKATWEDMNENTGVSFEHNQLPGATNYREHLMQMPEDTFTRKVDDKLDWYKGQYFADHKQHPSESWVKAKRAEVEKDVRAYPHDYDYEPSPNRNAFYGDWDEPDVIAHTRLNDRDIPGVGRALHVEEAGSQVHQKGKEVGYRGQQKIDISKFSAKEVPSETINGSLLRKWVVTDDLGDKNYLYSPNKEKVIQDAYEMRHNRMAPDLPFKNTHQDLIANRMLHEAATEGYDALSWTPHEMQREGYGSDSNKEFHARIEALAKKYGGKIEKKPYNAENYQITEEKRGDKTLYKIVYGHDNKEVSSFNKADIDKIAREEGKNNHIYVLRLTPEMKRIFGHDDFSMFPQKAAENKLVLTANELRKKYGDDWKEKAPSSEVARYDQAEAELEKIRVGGLPLQRQVLERGRSGRPVKTEPLPIGTEQGIMDEALRRVRAVAGPEGDINSRIRSRAFELMDEKPNISLGDAIGLAEDELKGKPAPTFYSGLSRTIERAPMDSATPSHWAKYLRDTVGTRQAEEFEHVGLEGKVGSLKEATQIVERPAQQALDQWKTANKGQRPPKELIDAASNENKRLVEQKLKDRDKERPISKAELTAHVQENQPKFKEIHKGAGNVDAESITRRADEIMERDYSDVLPGDPIYQHTYDHATVEAEEELRGKGGTQYGEYVLPGGTNYREHLMTMPNKDKTYILDGLNDAGDVVVKERGTNNIMHEGTPESAWEYLREMNALGKGDEQHFSSHWDEPNVIVHTRMNDRFLPDETGTNKKLLRSPDKPAQDLIKDWGFTTNEWKNLTQAERDTVINNNSQNGLRSLHAEEFQSDLHQEGRKKGYTPSQEKLQGATQKVLDAAKGISLEFKNRADRQIRNYPDESLDRVFVMDVSSPGLDEKALLDYMKAKREQVRISGGTVPDLPFKKSWPDLAIKRWLREAVDNDYDAVSWTPGEAQRDRFQLAHHVEDLAYWRLKDNTYALHAKKKNGDNIPINRGLPIKENELDRWVGDAVAEKIKKGEGKITDSDEDFKVLSNQDLKVGGEGLVSFYDKTIKGKVQALVERFGGKVEKQKIPHPGGKSDDVAAEVGLTRWQWDHTTPEIRKELMNKNNKHFVWTVKLTPEMKRAIRREGFPLFSSGLPTVPVDHDPFEKKKGKPKPELVPVDHDPFNEPSPDMGGKLNKMLGAAYVPRRHPLMEMVR